VDELDNRCENLRWTPRDYHHIKNRTEPCHPSKIKRSLRMTGLGLKVGNGLSSPAIR